MIPECQQYAASLASLHGQLAKYVEGLDGAALDWTPVAGANGLAVIVVHAVGSERFLIGQLVGGIDAHRDRDAEFRLHDVDAGHLKRLVSETGAISAEVLSRLSEEDLSVQRAHRDGPKTTRWCIVHGLEHLAEHVGHAGLTRQLWDAQH
jgi:hypothetical protein